MNVSVIICVYNRPIQLSSCLESLAAMNLNDSEVLVVDDASTDSTFETATAFKAEHPAFPLRIIRSPSNLGVAGARNLGVANAKGEFVAFTDSDCIVEPSWLVTLLRQLGDSDVVAVSGTVLDRAPRTFAERAYAGSCAIGRTRIQGRSLIGGNMAFRREIVQEFLFDPALRYGADEEELAWRLKSLGFKIGFEPLAIVHHEHPLTAGEYFRMALQLARGSTLYWYKRGTFLGRDVMPGAIALLTSPIVLIDPRLGVVPAAFALLQLQALLFAEVVLKGKGLCEGLRVLPMIILFYLWKGWGITSTYFQIFWGREDAIRASKKRWNQWLQERPPGSSLRR